MNQTYNHKLNSHSRNSRISALLETLSYEKEYRIKVIPRENDANNHIHTTYSFSPYSPTAAAYEAYKSGLKTCGIMDHDTLGGAEEFSQACKILNIGYTTGVEMRVKFKPGQWGRINHPDQVDCAYVAAHGIPSQSIADFESFMKPYRIERHTRNQHMINKINDLMKSYEIHLDYHQDVYMCSEAEHNGTITERHIMNALAKKLEEKYGRTVELVNFLEHNMGYHLTPKQVTYLTDKDNGYFLFDLLGVLKTNTRFFYIDADEEMPTVEQFIEVTKRLGGIPAYAYLGDVTQSITGDKAAQAFEDRYLDQFVLELKRLGFEAIAYMPTRNTMEQLNRVKDLCEKYQLIQISGEDINSPRQSFQCASLERPEFSHLIRTTWALIGHERSIEKDFNKGLLSKEIITKYPDLDKRLAFFEYIGRTSIKNQTGE